MTGEALLEARQIVKELGQGAGMVRALKGVDLGLYGGELTLLMGPSGSGKTTLLSILGCILSPTEGEVVLCGSSTKGLKPEGLARLRRTHVGFVFQDYNLFPTLTAAENIRLALDVRGMPKAEQRATAEEALVKVGLKDKINSYPSQMSGGQQQRVAIARALAGKPAVILADEPTAALDSENGQAIMALLSEIAQDKTRAVLAVTHDPRTLGYADRIVHIEDGLIVREERPVKTEKPVKDDAEPAEAAPERVFAEPEPAAAKDISLVARAGVVAAEAGAVISPSGGGQSIGDELAHEEVVAAPDNAPIAEVGPSTFADPVPQRPSLASHTSQEPNNRRRRSHRYARGDNLP